MRIHLSKSAIVAIGIFVLLAAFYGLYVHRQNANLFFEANFIHAEFLQDILNRRLTGHAFFTVFGEHLFPGFNLILALNLLLFRIWGGFDSIVYGIFLIATAALVVQHIWITAPWQYRTAGVAFISLLLMSTTNNPQWGMALAATVGVFLFVWIARLMTEALWGSGKTHPLLFVLIPIAQLLFLGGYAIGAIASIGALLLVHSTQNRTVAIKSIAIGATVAVMVVIYVVILNHYTPPAIGGELVDLGPNIVSILKFAAVMTGASMMSRALVDQVGTMWPLIVVGSFLIAVTVIFWVDTLRRPTKAGMFVFALSIYSATNIIVVAIVRYHNGIDGAMGQWYNAHTHFLAVGVVYFLFSKINRRVAPASLASGVFLIGLLGFELAAYSADWKKAPFVAEYKERYIAQAPVILAFPELIIDKSDPTQTMLWKYATVKPAIDMMYKHRLWIFNIKDPEIYGTTFDDWIESNKHVTAMCPAGSEHMRVQLWRDEKWSASSIKVRISGVDKEYPANGLIDINVPNGIAVALFDASDVQKSNPISPGADTRKLVAKIINITCQ
jgi:hypothetical protein